jgi:hypothetical protein
MWRPPALLRSPFSPQRPLPVVFARPAGSGPALWTAGRRRVIPPPPALRVILHNRFTPPRTRGGIGMEGATEGVGCGVGRVESLPGWGPRARARAQSLDQVASAGSGAGSESRRGCQWPGAARRPGLAAVGLREGACLAAGPSESGRFQAIRRPGFRVRVRVLGSVARPAAVPPPCRAGRCAKKQPMRRQRSQWPLSPVAIRVSPSQGRPPQIPAAVFCSTAVLPRKRAGGPFGACSAIGGHCGEHAARHSSV